MSNDLAKLIALKFIQRRDVKAVQIERQFGHMKPGDWMPDRAFKNKSVHGEGFKLHHLEDHLNGKHTYGHYLLDQESRARVFCLDIDLEKAGSFVEVPDRTSIDPWKSDEEYEAAWKVTEISADDLITCRDLWLDRKATIARNWWKMQMKMLASKFAAVITKDMELPCAATYSGSKGIHVYGFLGDSTGQEAQDAAQLAVKLVDEFEAYRGKVFFKHRNTDPIAGYPSFQSRRFQSKRLLKGRIWVISYDSLWEEISNLQTLPFSSTSEPLWEYLYQSAVQSHFSSLVTLSKMINNNWLNTHRKAKTARLDARKQP